jgi:hypothetical protein
MAPPNLKPTPERCWVCGCTWNNPCPEGCSWADDTHTICTNPICLRAARRLSGFIKAADRVLKHAAGIGDRKHHHSGRGICIPFGALEMLKKRTAVLKGEEAE